ncbi:MAG: hypothetical protein KME06_21865 [Kastovskya adunca ATA6-11-RM4]|jgi:hypothetical protein|nr:hypothetical protein [Kastovskya adunca ATA6-11-RM4]
MRYLSLLLLLPLSLPLLSLRVTAGDAPTLTAQARPSQDFFPQAQRLMQEQLNLINRMEKALVGADLNRLEAVRGQLFLHVGAVERFLTSQYRLPQVLCNNDPSRPAPSVALTASQQQVYCTLNASTRQLAPLLTVLEGRLPTLTDLAAVEPEARASRRPLGQRFNFRGPATPRYAPAPDLPPAEPPVLGIPAKTPIANYQPPLQPAIIAPQRAIAVLQAARERLLSAQRALPPSSLPLRDPSGNAEAIRRGSYGLSPLAPQQYAKFLNLPNTGIARILTAEAYRLDPNQLRNRLQPTVAEEFPFAPLRQPTNEFTPRLTLQIDQGNLQLALPELNYGFIADLGEVSLEDLDASLQNIPTLSAPQRQFFLNYVPPNKLEALQVDRQRFLTGKAGFGFVPPLSPPVSTQTPVVLNHTYLLRLVQFQLPDVIVTGQPISRERRRYVDLILETPSSDVLVAVQPVDRRIDGSYTVLWRVLNQYPDPQIVDLEAYVQLE